MTPVVQTLRRNDQLTLADDLMSAQRIRHLPVLDEEGLLCGVVSQRDLFRGALAKALGYGATARQKMHSMLLVKEVMSTSVVTIGPHEPLANAARLMIEHKSAACPCWRARSWSASSPRPTSSSWRSSAAPTDARLRVARRSAGSLRARRAARGTSSRSPLRERTRAPDRMNHLTRLLVRVL